ncbi:DNA primase [Candidatus Woesearchaeota archaeon]|nr:DNA primase [Candidatus Woesearchaeota archaeon]
MGKISPVSAKYIVHASIEIEGVVERPDVIGAIFGQTEGLLGADLELRELQRSGRIGRIEVNIGTKSGKSRGSIIIPSSLDKAETSIVGAALEVIQRIGPCNAKIKVNKIEDVRVSKRKLVVERAKELLKQMTDKVLPDSQELSDEVAHSVRVMEIQQYGKDRLPAGPAIEESDEIIVVEGRADVLNLLKHGIKNAIAMNGTSCPDTIKDLSRKKIVTAFVDGDRGGNLIIKELTTVADLDHVSKAPDGKEVEEITKKEIHKALRAKIASEQAKMEISNGNSDKHDKKRSGSSSSGRNNKKRSSSGKNKYSRQNRSSQRYTKSYSISPKEKSEFKNMLEDLIGTRGAYILDGKMNIMGKVPISELSTTVKSLNTSIYAIVLDGMIDKQLLSVAESARVEYLISMKSKIDPSKTRINVLTESDL